MRIERRQQDETEGRVGVDKSEVGVADDEVRAQTEDEEVAIYAVSVHKISDKQQRRFTTLEGGWGS